MAALLGASPGASACVSSMLGVIEDCMPELLVGLRRQRLKALIPSYGRSLIDNPRLLNDVRSYTQQTLNLVDPDPEVGPEDDWMLLRTAS